MNKNLKLVFVALFFGGLVFSQLKCLGGAGAADEIDLEITPSGDVRWCGFTALNKIKQITYGVTVSVIDPNTGYPVNFNPTKFFERTNDWKESDSDNRVFKGIKIPIDGQFFQITIVGRVQCSKCTGCAPPAFEGQGILWVIAQSNLSNTAQTSLSLGVRNRDCPTTYNGGGQIMDCD
jgi:hypothetical protein